MKKNTIGKIAVIIFIAIASFITNYSSENNETSLFHENVEALAGGEVDIPAICANVNPYFCYVFSDGYFLTGLRVS